MISRIRYLRIEDGKFVNKTPLIGNGDLLKVEIDGLHFRVLSSTGRIRAETLVPASSSADLKKQIKAALKAEGVNFLDEVRSKRIQE